MRTRNQIVSDFKTYSGLNIQVKTFMYGQEFEQVGNENIIYPLMYVVPISSNINATSFTRTFRIIFADRVLKDESNELEIESDTELMCTDVLAYFRRQGQDNNYIVSDSATIQQFWEKWTDEVTGNFIDLTFDDYFDYNSCSIPLTN